MVRKRNQIAVSAAKRLPKYEVTPQEPRKSWEDASSEQPVDASQAEVEDDTTSIDVAPNFDIPPLDDVYDNMVDSRYAESVCRRLRMTRSDVWRLRKVFNDIDVDRTNTITMQEFFFLIQEKPCSLTKTILRLAGVPPRQTRLRFDEYLCCVCRFAAFSEPELVAFVFTVYKSDKERGVMQGEDMEALVHGLMTVPASYARNVKQATLAVTEAIASDHAEFSMYDLQQLAHHNHVAFFPILRMQRHVRAATLGETYWLAKRDDDKHIEEMVAYMTSNYGIDPPWSWKDLILETLRLPWRSRPSKQELLREHARRQYEATQK